MNYIIISHTREGSGHVFNTIHDNETFKRAIASHFVGLSNEYSTNALNDVFLPRIDEFNLRELHLDGSTRVSANNDDCWDHLIALIN